MNPNTKTVISLLTLFLLFNFFISFIATEYIPYLGYYSYPELLDRWDLPFFIERFAGFDGLHYIKIALEGYERNATASCVPHVYALWNYGKWPLPDSSGYGHIDHCTHHSAHDSSPLSQTHKS